LLANSTPSKLQKLLKSAGTEWEFFGSTLDLDEFIPIGHDDVEVHVGCRVFRVIQVEHRHTFEDADTDGRHIRANRTGRQSFRRDQPVNGLLHRDVGAWDGSSTRSAVRFYDVPVHDDLKVAKLCQHNTRRQPGSDHPRY